MRGRDRKGFLLCFLMNLALDIGWSIPAWAALAAHFVLKISVLWFVLLLSVWLAAVLLRTVIISWVSRCSGASDSPKKNVNPYSASTSDFIKKVNGEREDDFCREESDEKGCGGAACRAAADSAAVRLRDGR